MMFREQQGNTANMGDVKEVQVYLNGQEKYVPMWKFTGKSAVIYLFC